MVLSFCACAAAPLVAQTQAAMWPAWRQFADAFVQDNGRVVDWTSDARSISEGQAYALFFALVANERPRFERILRWTEDNLAQGDLHRHLPSWLWGADVQRSWRVLDPNPAADADLWLAYSLMEAGRLWRRADYVELGRAVLAQVAQSEVIRFAGRTLLLPGPIGFDTPQGPRQNPSYLPPFVLSYLAEVDRQGPWREILDDFLSLLPELAPSGGVPDWFVLTADGPRKDTLSDGRGSYDAVRVYLWFALDGSNAPAHRRAHAALAPFAEFVRQAGRLPEHWYPDGRAPEGLAPAGMEAALLPFYAGLGASDLVAAAQKRRDAETSGGLVGNPARYYEQVLNLFAQGWLDRRYSFDALGRLRPAWLG